LCSIYALKLLLASKARELEPVRLRVSPNMKSHRRQYDGGARWLRGSLNALDVSGLAACGLRLCALSLDGQQLEDNGVAWLALDAELLIPRLAVYEPRQEEYSLDRADDKPERP